MVIAFKPYPIQYIECLVYGYRQQGYTVPSKVKTLKQKVGLRREVLFSLFSSFRLARKSEEREREREWVRESDDNERVSQRVGERAATHKV